MRTDVASIPDRVPVDALPPGRVATGAALRSSVVTSIAGKATEMVTLGLLAVVVPRVLGPTAYGRFAVPLTIVTLGSLAMTLGGHTLMARYVPAAGPQDRVPLALAIGSRLARGRTVQLAGVAVTAGLLVAWHPRAFPPLVTGLVVAALVVNVATTLALQVGLGLGRTAAWSLRYPLHNAVLILAVLGLHRPFGSTGAVVAILIAACAAAALGAAVIAPLRGAGRSGVEVPRGALRFGALHAAGAALVQCSQRGGVLVVALLAGSAVETGYAALAVGIALGVTYAVLQAFTVALPHLADGRNPSEAEAVLRRLAGGLLVAIVPAAAAMAVSLDVVVPAVFGADYGGAAAAFGPALGLVVLAPVHSLSVQAAALRFRPAVALVAGLSGAGAFVAVSVATVPSWGAAGATASAFAGAAVGAAVSIRMLPGAVGGRVAATSFLGAVAVLVLAIAA